VSTATFVCLTNIPTPYRLFLFRRMHQRLNELGWRFEVWFMAGSESGRQWAFKNSDFQFPHRFLGAKSLRIGSTALHWNPEISHVLRDACPDVLLVAGAWIHPTVLLAALSSTPARTIFWSESHLESIRQRGFLAGLTRRWMLSRFSEFAVPGRLAKRYVEHHAAAARIYYLPNVVDPAVFRMYRREGDNGLIGSQDQNRRVLLIVARLAAEKGLIPFLHGVEKLGPEDRYKLTVLIAGSGSLKKLIQRWIVRHNFDVQLLGQQTQSQIAQLYARADGFCLPSISDPNPISVIEASWAGLPLLLSSRVGNHPECLESGRNGFVFESADPESVATAVSRWLGLTRLELTAFGENSVQIARSSFDPDTVVSNFLDEILAESPRPAESRLESAASAR